MPAIEYLSWDGDGGTVLPHRPSTDNLGGDDLEDDEAAPPGPGDPNSPAWNAKVRHQVAVAKTAAAAKFTVTYSGATPQFELFAACGSIVVGALSIADDGTGVVEVTWPANSFPPASVWPHGLTLHADGRGWATNITNGVRVETVDAAGDPANIPFTICIG